MPRFHAIVVVAGLALAAGCANHVTGPDAVAGTPFELRAGTTASLPDGSRLTFERVSADSRCPMDAMCVSAGDATVAVTLKTSNGAAEPGELHTQPTGSQLRWSDYTITLTGLAPSPRSGQPIRAADYSATFVLSVR